jgi:hypothetical protein
MSVTFDLLIPHETYGAVCAGSDLSVNVSNANARELLVRMGFVSDDLCGSADADVFFGRAFLLANGASMELPTTESGGEGTGQARMIDCGRSADYHRERGTWLMELAREAQAQGARIGWS